jgi:protein phosphatase 1 regulatory subunit 36
MNKLRFLAKAKKCEDKNPAIWHWTSDNRLERHEERIIEPPINKFKEIEGFVDTADVAAVVFRAAARSEYSSTFHRFVTRQSVKKFLNNIAIYFENFLKIEEFLRIRQGIGERDVKIKNLKSLDIERNMSKLLQLNRAMVARQYSEILLGNDDMHAFHHMTNKIGKSQTEKELALYEMLLKFSKEYAWIVHFRQKRGVIATEIDRLFRTPNFISSKPDSSLSYRDQQILHGQVEVMSGKRNRVFGTSPLINELLKISPAHSPILNIDVYKYKGGNEFMKEFELEYVTPPVHLSLTYKSHGILGKPKKLFNRNLVINWCSVRDENYSAAYDPYCLFEKSFVQTTTKEYLPADEKPSKPTYKIKSIHH